MELNEYQKKAKETAMYPNVGENITYPVLGLAGEAGEIANRVKKIQRDEDNVLSKETKETIIKELGDVLWYVAILASELDSDLESVAKLNIEKLASRKERGVIGGSGDNR